MTNQILIAGFGGQGVLFAGKLLAYGGLMADQQVSWLPSYGPEMRGGTANCSVILSDDPIGSPIVSTPDVLMVMNLPSLDKYEDTVAKGGKIFVDSTLIEREVERKDVSAFYIPATRMAQEAGYPTLANMILLGKMMRETGMDLSVVDAALSKVVSAKRQDLLEVNKRVIRMGYEY